MRRKARHRVPPAQRLGRPAVRALQYAVLGVVLVYVGRALSQRLRQVPWADVEYRLIPAGAAVCAALVARGLSLANCALLLRAFGSRISWRRLAAAAWVSPLGKYVPGKIASLGGALYLLKRSGVRVSVAGAAVAVQQGLVLSVGLIMAAPVTVWMPVEARWPWAWLWCAGLGGVGLALMHPRVLGAAVNRFMRRSGRTAWVALPRLRDFAGPAGVSVLQWIIGGFALWTLLAALQPVSLQALPLCVSATALASVAGYLAFFAPAGIGVREGVYLVVLSGAAEEGRLALIVILMRLIYTAVELVLAGAGAALWRMADRRDATGAPVRPSPLPG